MITLTQWGGLNPLSWARWKRCDLVIPEHGPNSSVRSNIFRYWRASSIEHWWGSITGYKNNNVNGIQIKNKVWS